MFFGRDLYIQLQNCVFKKQPCVKMTILMLLKKDTDFAEFLLYLLRYMLRNTKKTTKKKQKKKQKTKTKNKQTVFKIFEKKDVFR